MRRGGQRHLSNPRTLLGCQLTGPFPQADRVVGELVDEVLLAKNKFKLHIVGGNGVKKGGGG